MSISSTMFRAVVFNNEGVRRMEHEMFDDAVISFTAVLQELNPILPHSPAQHMLRDSSTVTTPSATPLQVSSFQRNNQQQQYHLQQQQQQQQQQQYETSSSETRKEWESSSSSSSSTLPWPSHGSGGGCGPSGGSGHLRIDDHGKNSMGSDCCGQQHFIFRDPIEIPFEVVPTMTEPSDRLINKFVVVILYNLALSVHMSAVQHHDRTCLIRARKLYELAFQMHLEDSCDVTLLYSLALMNNLGLIYHLLGEEDRSQTCFKNMLATMMYLLESDEAKTIKQWDGLLSNVMDRMFKGQEVAAPAA